MMGKRLQLTGWGGVWGWGPMQQPVGRQVVGVLCGLYIKSASQ